MAVIVGTDSYVSEDELAAYALARAVAIVSDKTVLLYKAMDWLEIQPYLYDKTDSTQDLEFPRNDETTVPANVEKAQMVAALLIDGGATLLGTVERAVKREKVASLEVEYMNNTGETAHYPELTLLLREWLANSGSFVVARG